MSRKKSPIPKSQINFRMEDTLIEALKAKAESEGISFTELLTRFALLCLGNDEENASSAIASHSTPSRSRMRQSQVEENPNLASRLATLERLVASELDTLALVNRIALLESRFVDAIHKQQLRLEALENRYTGTSLQENPHPPSDGTQAESEVLSRLAGWENQLAEIESWQQTLASVREQTEKGTEAHSRLEDYVKQQLAQLQAQISELQDTICASQAIATPNAKLQKETTDKIAATQLPSELVKTSHKEAMPPVGVAPEADAEIAAEPISNTVQLENENNQLSTGDVLPEVAGEQELTFAQPQTAATDKTLTPESSSPTKEEELTPPVLPLSNSSTTAPSLATNSALDSSPDTTPNPESDNANCSELELTPEEMAEHLGVTKSAVHQEAVKGHEAFRKWSAKFGKGTFDFKVANPGSKKSKRTYYQISSQASAQSKQSLPNDSGLTAVALGKRIGVSGAAVRIAHKRQGNKQFALWSQANDRDGMAWSKGEDGLYYPVDADSLEQV